VGPAAVDALASGLSGGNQQKLIFARELSRQPRFILAAQPTRGVDVGAIEMIHRKLLEARTQGVGVLLLSSELDEILGLSDRILVLYRGQWVAEFRRGEADERAIGLAMGGASGRGKNASN
jgi:simple sugar transport system ATP-binding protein